MENAAIAISTYGHHNMGHHDASESSQYIIFSDREAMLKFCERAQEIVIPGSHLVIGAHPIWEDSGLGDLWDEPGQWHPVVLGDSQHDLFIARFPEDKRRTQLHDDGSIKEIIVEEVADEPPYLHVLTSLEQYLLYLRKVKMGQGCGGSARHWGEQKFQYIRICEELLGLPLTPFPEDPYMEGQKLLKRLLDTTYFHETGLGTAKLNSRIQRTSEFDSIKRQPASPANLCEFLMALEIRGIDTMSKRGYRIGPDYEEAGSKFNYPIRFIIEDDNIVYWEKDEPWHQPGKVL